MKSIFFGIYGNFHDNFQVNQHIFSCNDERKVINIHLNKFQITLFEASTPIFQKETENFFLVICGDFELQINIESILHLETSNILELVLQNLNGEFSLCLYDKTNEIVSVANDFFGLYPLFYYKNEDYLMFCNEYEPLLIQNNEIIKISNKNLKSYFEHGFAFSGDTFFEEIKMLTARQLLQLRGKSLDVRNYSTFKPIQFDSYEHCLNELYQALKKSVNRLNRLENKIVTITGGLDTRIILALTNSEIRKSNNYVTFYLKPLNESNDKDVLISKLISEKFELNHRAIPFEEKTDELTLGYFDILRKDDFSIKITGLFGGELLSGILYENVLPENTNNLIDNLISKRDIFSVLLNNENSKLKKAVKKNRKEVYFNALTNTFFSSIYNGSEGSWVHPWMNSLRYYSPFADTDFLKIWFSVPESYLFESNHSLYYDMYAKYFSSYKDIPTNSFLKDLSKNGFIYFEDGIEPKKVKKDKSDHLYNEIKASKGYRLIPKKFKNEVYISNRNNKQRFIDFCIWYDYVISIFRN